LATRAFSLKADPTFKFATDLSTAHATFMEEATPKEATEAATTDTGELNNTSEYGAVDSAATKASSEQKTSWPMDALHPVGFDVLKDGPVNLLAELREATAKPLQTPEEIDQHIEAWMDENTYPKTTWLPAMILFFVVMFLLPVVVNL
jgi:hypothetical protein